MIDFLRLVPKKRTVKIRRKKGVVFNNPSGVVRLFFYLGNLVLFLALLGLIYIYLPWGKAYWNYKFHSETEESIINQSFSDETDFSIQIPKILAEAKIVKNVSPFSAMEYLKVLNNGVIAQAVGSDLPNSGKGTTTYLFAHSSQEGIDMARKNAVFYLLGELVEGDIFDIKYEGKVYYYKIYQKKVISPKEVDYLSYRDPNKEVVILQTCWPVGTDWRRLLVFGERIN